MDIGEPERSGRHRLEDGAAIWLPMGGELDHTPLERAPARPAPPPPPPPDPMVDTDAMGLRKFNIGLVPASVTPPRTWRFAAWFAVLSSAGVLVGLAVAAASLVGTNGPTERIGLPGYPTDVPLLSGYLTTPPAPTPPSTARRQPAEAVANGLVAASGERAASGPAADRTGATSGPQTSAHVTTVPADAQPIVDPETIAENTELFYEGVAANSGTALTLVSDTFRLAGEVLLAEQFGDVALIEVQEITVDPTRGITVSTLEVTRKDGSRSTERRELVFTTGGVPLIDGERRASGA